MLEAVATVSQVVDREVRIRIGMHTGDQGLHASRNSADKRGVVASVVP